jgi:hypothetical protein
VEIVWRFITSQTGHIAVAPTMHASAVERACATPVARLLGDGGKRLSVASTSGRKPRRRISLRSTPDQLGHIVDQIGSGLTWTAECGKLADTYAGCIVQPVTGLAAD